MTTAALPDIVRQSLRRIEAVSYHGNYIGALVLEIAESADRKNGFILEIILRATNGMELLMARETDVNERRRK